jgi:hypothetical protein
MQERRIHPAEGLEVRSLFPRPLPFFIVAVVALLAIFRSDEDFLNLGNPIIGRLSVGLLGNGSIVKQPDQADRQGQKCHGNDPLSGLHGPTFLAGC